MADIEKIIKGVEHCLFGEEVCDDAECPYWNDWSAHCCLSHCQSDLKKDLLVLLKEQSQIVRCKNCKYYNPDEYEPGTGDCMGSCDNLVKVSDEWFCPDGTNRCHL